MSLNFFWFLLYTSNTFDLFRKRMFFMMIYGLLNLIILILFCRLLIKNMLPHHFIYSFLRNIRGNTSWSSTVVLVSTIILIRNNWKNPRILKHLNLSVSWVFLRNDIEKTCIFLQCFMKLVLTVNCFLSDSSHDRYFEIVSDK